MFFIGFHKNRQSTELPLNRCSELVAGDYWYYRTLVVMGVYVNKTPIFIGRNAPKTNYRINGTEGEGKHKKVGTKSDEHHPDYSSGMCGAVVGASSSMFPNSSSSSSSGGSSFMA